MNVFAIYMAMSATLVGLYRWFALRYRWLDAPNHRSSHAAITPRGAGLIFALLIVGASAQILHSYRPLWLSFSPGLAVALVGWWDDLRGASARVRFAFYTISAAVTVTLIFNGGLIASYEGRSLALMLTCGLLATIALVWLINLYNFMDGINGIAAGEALFVLGAIGVLGANSSYASTFSLLHLVGAGAIAGFLIWNFPAGKVFMGDAGSAFLGFFLGALMLWSSAMQGPSLAVWLILLGIFVVDTGYTLAVRVLSGQRWYMAHRSHAYQRLTDKLKASHTRAVGLLMFVNVAWLLPMAWLVHNHLVHALYGLGIAYLPLIAACYRLKAGIPITGGV